MGRGAAQDLVLHLQPTLLAAQPHQLVLLPVGLPVDNAVVDVRLTHPAAHRLDRNVEVASASAWLRSPRRATRTTSRLNSGGNFFGTGTSFLRDHVPQMECQPVLQQSPSRTTKRRERLLHRPAGVVPTIPAALRPYRRPRSGMVRNAVGMVAVHRHAVGASLARMASG